MSLVVVGINHRTAPVEVRERVVFEPARIPEALQQLRSLPEIRESVIVSTCNRTELYCVTDGAGEARTRRLAAALPRPRCLAAPLPLPPRRGQGGRPRLRGGVGPRLDGARRAADPRPAEGRLSRGAGSGHDGPVLNRLFQSAFSVAKRVRTETKIGANAVSVASAAVAMARTVFASFDEPHRAAGRRRRDRGARGPPPVCRRPAAHDHRQPQRRPRARAGRGVPRLRHRRSTRSRTTSRKPTSSSPRPRRRTRSSRAT